MDQGKPTRPQSYTKNEKQLRDSESVSNSILQAYQLVAQFQTLSHEYVHTSNIIQTEQVTFRNTYAYTYMHVTINIEKRGQRFGRIKTEEREGINGVIILDAKIKRKIRWKKIEDT